MNLKEIKEMITLMNENDLTEIEIEREGTKIKLKKSTSDSPEIVHSRPRHYQAEHPQPAAEPNAPAPAVNSKLKEVKSPMVGTFYRSPTPDAAPFVESGQVVEIGQVVCIVEAMKLMNEIDSPCAGKIAKILLQDGQVVEYGEVLFLIDPS